MCVCASVTLIDKYESTYIKLLLLLKTYIIVHLHFTSAMR